MPATPVSVSTCATCGEPLNARRECLACLVRGGLDQPGENSEVSYSLVYGDFEIETREDGSLWELGHGAMGVTYRALDQVLQRTVALKVIEMPAEERAARAARERFLREARSAAALRHPNVAGVFQFGAKPSGDRCFYAMELVEGETLEALVRREGPLRPELGLEIALQVTRAMMAAAAQGLIHRDLKPANIMLARPGDDSDEVTVKVIDFGLAKSTAVAARERDLSHGGFVGTPTFASPEQLGGASVDARSDIYSLGVTLWYALTGEVPCPGTTIDEIRSSQAEIALPVGQLVARKIPPPLIKMLRRCLATDPVARPQSARALIGELELCRAALAAAPRRRRAALALGLVALCALGLTTYLWRHRSAGLVLAPEKSIAVLPFENLSRDEANAFFVAGIQDDLVTSLTQIRALKVISRTSVMAYQPGPRNLREIGKALAVAAVLEGSVRRAGDRVVVNVQLVDTRTERELWANHYDQSLADSLGLQGELANEIAAALQAKLAPDEKARLETKPTSNPEAYALYLRARGREAAVNESIADLTTAAQLYTRAVALDPKFALAYARLSIADSFLAYQPSSDPALRAKARAAAEEALRLSHSLGEAHLALGLCFYFTNNDDPVSALRELSLAAATSPNDPEILEWLAGSYQKQGFWREASETYEHAQELDPRNRDVILRAADNYLLVRDWDRAAACYERALKLAPDSADARISLAYIAVFRDGNLAAGKKLLHDLPPGVDPDGIATESRWDLAMLGRDFANAEKILIDSPLQNFPRSGEGAKEFFEGRTARARGDFASAQRHFAAAAPHFEAWTQSDPDNGYRHAELGQLYAYMQREEDAVREGQRAVALNPESRNAFLGSKRSANLALIYALLGKPEEAIPLLEHLLSTPGPIDWPDTPHSITLAELRLRWEWDSLRGDPRFQKLLAGPEPRTDLTNKREAAQATLEKSIAVLPFENLSDDKQNAYFAAGLQDDVLTSLAQIQDLKVISRTSVMAYQQSHPRNIREIAQALGVENILEGSVRREGNRVLLNVQLIDARHDRHIWAHRYDRTAADSIGLQGELATQIATALEAKLAPEVKSRLALKPTDSPEGYALYLKGLGQERTVNHTRADRIAAARLYSDAIALDPKFALAYARLSIVHSNLMWPSGEPTHKREARRAAEEAMRLAPALGEAHMALGLCLYWADENYSAALREFSIARASLPNEPDILHFIAGIDRRQGRWKESLAAYEQACQIDPRNRETVIFSALDHLLVRDWVAADALFRRALEIAPESVPAKIGLAYLEIFRQGSPAAARAILREVPANLDPDGMVAAAKWDLAMLQRDFSTAEKIVKDFPGRTFPEPKGFPKEFFLAQVARARGDRLSAERLLAAIEPEVKSWKKKDPDDPYNDSYLASYYAYRGRKEEAVRAAEHSIASEPESANAYFGADRVANLALAYALTGERDKAIVLIERLLTTPGPVQSASSRSITLAELRLRWEWDSLRSDPRFQKILAGPEPKTSLTNKARVREGSRF